MGKRGHGEGTIYQRASDDRWQAQLRLPDGKRKSLYGKTRADVTRKLREAQRTLDGGLPFARDERVSVATYLARWLDAITSQVRPQTKERYRQHITHVVAAVGKVALTKLTPQHLDRLYAQLLDDTNGGPGLSATTVNQLHTVLHQAFDDAIRKGVLVRNITDLVDAPRKRQHEMTPLTPEQVTTLLTAAQGDRLEALYVLAITTGMRRGELLGLRWADVDLDGRSLSVRFQLLHEPPSRGGGWRLNPPKTAKGRRRIDLSQTSIEALRSHRARQAAERLALGEAWADHGFVFTREDGEPLRGVNMVEHQFWPLLKRAGLPRVRFHDLRHTAATLLLLGNVPVKVVSEMLGHATTAITSDRYSHVLPSMQRNASDVMDRVLAHPSANVG